MAIRTAPGRDTDADPRFLAVVLDTFMRALPHTLREVTTPVGTQVDGDRQLAEAVCQIVSIVY